MIKRALISVYEKKGLGDLVKKLCEFGVKILSSGGTGEKLRELGYPVTDIITYTGYPEMPDALVKTLHPQIHGGILLNPSNPIHHAYMKEQGIEKIDMVVVNFYPLPKMKTYDDIMLRDAAKHIDIGGPALARAAAKAALLYETLTVVTDTDQYKLVIHELEKNKGKISDETKRMLALKTFEKTKSYDEAIASLLSKISRLEDRKELIEILKRENKLESS